MKFTDILFQKVTQKKWDLDSFLTQLKQENLIIWGTGLAGRMTYDALERLHIPVSFFADSDKDKVGSSIYNKKILGINDIPSTAFILIAANVKYKIHEQLHERFMKYKYMDPLWLYSYEEANTLTVLEENSDLINTVYDMLSDNSSKKVYENILLHRIVHDISLVWEVYDTHQYFGNAIIKKAGKNFVDCGAFQGDTLLSYLEQMENGEPHRYYAFEADQNNYEILKKLCCEKELDWVTPINLGVWNKRGQLYFQGNQATGNVSGKIIGDNETGDIIVNVDSLDTVLGDAEIDFIKMDIEGAEIKALQGAKNCIKNNTPTLAISAYHELNHLWEIPLLIKEIDEDYEIMFGHHMWNMADTVCYGLHNKGSD